MADLDSILDDALEEFEEDDVILSEGAKASSGVAGAAAAASSSSSSAALREEMRTASSQAAAASKAAGGAASAGGMDGLPGMEGLDEIMKDPEFAKTLEETLKQLNLGGEGGEGGLGDLSALLGGADGSADGGGGGAGGPAGDMDKVMAATLAKLAEAAKNMEGMDTSAAEGMGEDAMKAMMEQFEKLGEKEDFDLIVEQMMKQLLGKDVMYEPMKQVTEKFPEWLADNESELSKEDYERYGRMYQYFQKIVAVYESEPNNFERLQELMQDMQECGQPPAELIKELAPGLEFGADGMPLMANMGPGVPGMPMPGMPFPGMGPGAQGLPLGKDGKPQCAVQ